MWRCRSPQCQQMAKQPVVVVIPRSNSLQTRGEDPFLCELVVANRQRDSGVDCDRDGDRYVGFALQTELTKGVLRSEPLTVAKLRRIGQ
jgi:hypothetical protein